MAKSFALWRLPGDTNIHFIEGRATAPGTAKGLYFSMRAFKPGDQNFDIEAESHEQYKPEQLPDFDVSGLSVNTAGDSHDKQDYLALVEKALQDIASGHTKKIVSSRCRQIPMPTGFNSRNYYLALCKTYPNAFIALIKHEALCWICATPEILLTVSEGTGHTVALAGTRALDDTEPFSEKEYLEQLLVQQDIDTQLQNAGIAYTKTPASELQAGNLKHLFTAYTLQGLTVSQAEQLAEALHPTPAVAGFPRAAALDFLNRNEGYDRSYYSGYLGPVMTNGDRYLYVNLRCMRVYANNLVLYAGGGINEGSVPEREWTETENKLKTLGNVL